MSYLLADYSYLLDQDQPTTTKPGEPVTEQPDVSDLVDGEEANT